MLSRWGLGPAHQGPFRRGTRLPTPAHYSSLLVPRCHRKKKKKPLQFRQNAGSRFQNTFLTPKLSNTNSSFSPFLLV